MLSLALLLAAPLAGTEPVASLRVEGGRSTFMVSIRSDDRAGYTVRFHCIVNCAQQSDHVEQDGDSPLGLFASDQSGLVYSLWSGGSAYRIRVWKIDTAHIERVAELSSRSWPNFLHDDHGTPVIETDDGASGAVAPQKKRWVFRQGRFEIDP